MEYNWSQTKEYKQIHEDLIDTFKTYKLIEGTFEIENDSDAYVIKEIEIWSPNEDEQEEKEWVEGIDATEVKHNGLYQFSILLQYFEDYEDPHLYGNWEAVSEKLKLIATKEEMKRQEKLDKLFAEELENILK